MKNCVLQIREKKWQIGLKGTVICSIVIPFCCPSSAANSYFLVSAGQRGHVRHHVVDVQAHVGSTKGGNLGDLQKF